jgi:hypothetical protein
MPRLDQTTEALPVGTTRTREEYRPRTVSDLGTPLVWSAVAGAAVGGFVALLGEPVRAAALVGLGVFGSAFLATSLSVIVGGTDRLHVLEETIQRDLDGDGVVGAPEREFVPVTLDVADGTRHRLLNLDLTPALRLFASRLLVDAVTFSEAGASECGVEAATFRAMRDQFLDRGLVAWKNAENPRSGYVMRRGYHPALKAVVDHSPGSGGVR